MKKLFLALALTLAPVYALAGTTTTPLEQYLYGKAAPVAPYGSGICIPAIPGSSPNTAQCIPGNAFPELGQTNNFTSTNNFSGTFEIGGAVMTFPSSGAITGNTDTQTLTGKTISGSSNTLTNLPAGNLTGNTPAAAMETNLAAAFYAEFTPTNGDCLIGTGTTAAFSTCPGGSGGSGTVGSGTTAQVGTYASSGTTVGGYTIGGDAAAAISGSNLNLTVTKTGGTNFGPFATGTNSANLTGNIPAAQMETNFAAALYAEFTPTNTDCFIGNGTTASFTTCPSGTGNVVGSGAATANHLISVTTSGGTLTTAKDSGVLTSDVPLLDGANAATGLNSNTPASGACPSGAGNLAPTVNVQSCTLSGAVALELPSSYAATQVFVLDFQENGTGGYAVTPSPQSSFLPKPGVLNSDGTLAISTAANAISEVVGHTATFGGTHYMILDSATGPLTAYGQLPTVANTPVAGSSFCGSPATTCTITATLTAGDTVVIPVADGCNNASCNGGTPPRIASITTTSGATLSSCAQFANTQGSDGGGNVGTEAWHCLIGGTSGSTAVQITFTVGSYYSTFGLVDLHGVTPTVDDGTGATTNGTGSTTSVQVASGGPTQTNEFCLSFAVLNTAATPTAGTSPAQTALFTSSSLGYIAQYQTSGCGSIASRPTESATWGASSGWSMLVAPVR